MKAIELVTNINTKEQYDKFIMDHEKYLLYFSLEDCNVCHDVFPRLMDIIDELPIKVAKIDINKQKEISAQNLVFTVPTILIFNEGKEILRESRFIDFYKIERILGLLECGT